MKKTITSLALVLAFAVSGIAHAQVVSENQLIDFNSYGSCDEAVQAIYQKINILEQELAQMMKTQHQVYIRPSLPNVDAVCHSTN